MRIVIDLQGAQSESRFRGIGRYSLALALGLARNAGQHEIWLMLNGALPDAIAELRAAFAGLVPPERICVFDIPAPVAEKHPEHGWRARAAEALREHALAALRPDAIIVTSLFEGYVDDAVVSVGALDSGCTTAVVQYDLIPLLKPDTYLPGPVQRQYYERKIASLKKAGLLLAISDYSRSEAIEALGLDEQRVVSISTAIDPCFHPAQAGAQQLAALRERFGIRGKFIMYAPGGFDARKNIDGLIEAYSQLTPALRSDYQLLIASKLNTAEQEQLQAHSKRCGVAATELILTNYVSDDTLIELYRITDLFVFPSKHEGFGLPALEAMACGAIVIGADNTSIPEVIGCAEALFDAGRPEAIAAKIGAVLGDAALRERLRAHGRQQAARFSWDASAQRALRAVEARHGAPAAPAPPNQRKRKLAFVTPLPPERTGIADYAVQLLPALLEHFEIELVVKQASWQLPAELSGLPVRQADWFARHADQYEQILYQFGNSPFHSHMFGLLQAHPGVVVLHDFYLSSVLAYEQMTGALPGCWHAALFQSHGYAALRAASAPGGSEAAKESYPCNLDVLSAAQHVIVHAEHARTLARQWYGAQAAGNWSVVPLPRSAPPAQDRQQARAALGIGDDVLLVCTFGFVADTKLCHQLLEAWIASSLHARQDCVLVFVGANHGGDYGARMTAAIAAAGGERIRIAGWCDEARYRDYLQAADIGVQLRAISRGETSAAVLDCMNYGLPTIVNANGSMAALPDETVCKLPDAVSTAELSAALERLAADPALRRELGERARTLLSTSHSPQHCASLYAQALDAALPQQRNGRRALLQALCATPQLPAQTEAEADAALLELAACVASLPELARPRQLLVDVSNIARHDLRTGIERVVRTQLLELLSAPASGLRVEPVYLSEAGGRWHYRYARQYAYGLLEMAAGAETDRQIDVAAGDILYCPDYCPAQTMAADAAGLYAGLRRRGVSVNVLVHDLLPVLRPEFFPRRADAGHAAWLACIAGHADRLICISAAVAEQLRDWLAEHAPALRQQPALAVLHHGADIGGDLLDSAEDGAAARPAPGAPVQRFLMVGTLEPRKGHLQTLDAFELLWRQGEQVELVIVGHEGWTGLPDSERRTIPALVQRLQQHPELGRRLFWLKGISDAELRQTYRGASALIFASEGEGFGLPLIEAASYGLPVLARDLPVFREVAQDAASYFSGLDGAALAEAVRGWLADYRAGRHARPDGMRAMSWRDNAQALLGLLTAAQR